LRSRQKKLGTLDKDKLCWETLTAKGAGIVTGFIVIMVLAIVVPVAVGIFCRRWADNYRADQSARVKTVGQALGLSDRVSKSALSSILREVSLFSLGRSHAILYALEGERNGVPITVFELQSNPGTGHTRSNSGVYLLMRSHALQSPVFALEPTDMHVGSSPIQFDSYPAFTKRFWLQGHHSNEAAVRDFFTPALLGYLLGQSQRIRLWGSGSYLLYGGGVNTFSQVTRADKLQALIDAGLGIYGQVAPATSPPETLPSPPPAVDAAAGQAQSAASNPVPTTNDLQRAAAQHRNQQVTPWVNPLQAVNSNKEQGKQRIAKLIVDLVIDGGTYKPNTQGMGARAYDGRQGKIVYTAPSEDPREARMRGEEAGTSQREMSREGLAKIIQASAESFFPVLNPQESDRVDEALAEQLLTAIAERGDCQINRDAYKISISPINGRFIYQCDVPLNRYQFQQVRRSLNHEDARQWLMKHDRSVFTDWRAVAPEQE
jgi:hypothetical protein